LFNILEWYSIVSEVGCILSPNEYFGFLCISEIILKRISEYNFLDTLP